MSSPIIKMQVTFIADEWAIYAAIQKLIMDDGLQPSRITRKKVQEVLVDWYEMYGSQMGSMDDSDVNAPEPVTDAEWYKVATVCKRLYDWDI